MTMTCQVCPSEHRREIDKALVLGEATRAIARRYGASKDALRRHRGCISEAIERAALRSGLSARSILERLVTRLETIADDTHGPDRELFLRTADRLTRAAESYGKITGEVQSATVQALFAELGVRDAGEIRNALGTVRTSEAAALDDIEREAVDSLRLVIAEHPERAARIVAALGLPEREPLALEAGNGNGSGAHA